MSMKKLFPITSVTDFGRPDIGMLFIRPDFAVPDNWSEVGWSDRTVLAEIETPDGRRLSMDAGIGMGHINARGSRIHPKKLWRIGVTLIGGTVSDVPVGSILYVPEEVAEALAEAVPER